MLGLRYVAGAIPGKSQKRITTDRDDQREKTKKYEENRKARQFNMKWLTNREWLDYDESNIMTCKTGLFPVIAPATYRSPNILISTK
jgi:hypothetical protein